jgi:hypothetical protein
MTDTARDQAAAQYETLAQMVAALSVDYDRLEELRELANAASDGGEPLSDLDRDELADLESDAGDANDEDEAREILDSDPLSVEVRSDWVTPGEEMTAGEFRIVLCTGGPAVQIRGELDEHGCPSHAWLEYQDWGTPWTEYGPADRAALLTYASHFIGG